jgi:hypothetical protein
MDFFGPRSLLSWSLPFPTNPHTMSDVIWDHKLCCLLSGISAKPSVNALLPGPFRSDWSPPPEYCARSCRSNGVESGALGVVENLAATAIALSVLLDGVFRYPGIGVEIPTSSTPLTHPSISISPPKSDQVFALAVAPSCPASSMRFGGRLWIAF